MRSFDRILTNIIRLPQRSLSWLGRRLDPNYRLEREARAVANWFTPAQMVRVEAIPGMCSLRECRLIALLATRAPAGGDIVEIGAWKGRVTAWLVEAAERRAERPAVISIDPHHDDSWNDFSRTVAEMKLTERGLQVRRESSRDAARGWTVPISFLWIDGSHEYDDVVRDIADFTPHVIAGGFVAFDDSAGGHFPGVERAIDEWRSATRGFAPVAVIRNTAIFRREA